MKFTKKELNILNCLEMMYKKETGIIAAEIEYILMEYFNNDVKIVNQILKKWNNEME